MRYFGVHVGFKGDVREIGYHFYPYKDSKGELLSYKTRRVEDKKMWITGQFKGVKPFGWDEAVKTGESTLYITEGEIDCMSLFGVIMKARSRNDKWRDSRPAVVSIPNGASGAVNCIKENIKEIRNIFNNVVLCFDMDEPGQKATREVLDILPEAVAVQLPAKDVNEAVLKGLERRLLDLVVFKKQAVSNSRLVSASSLFEKAKEPPKFGLSFPFPSMTKKTRGMRFGETTYIGAAQKMGKSEFVNELCSHFIKEHGLKCLLVKPEEANVKTIRMVASKMVGKIFHDPSKEFDFEAYERACGMIGDKLDLIDLYQNISWENLQKDIVEAVSKGVKVVFIDPLTNLTNHLSAAEANTRLQEIAQTLAAMAKDLDIHIFIFCHLKNKESGKPHDRGGEVLTSEFAGSRAMGRSCNYMWGIEGNKSPDLSEKDRNIRNLVLLDDREFGETGIISLFWDRNTGLFSEIPYIDIRKLGED